MTKLVLTYIKPKKDLKSLLKSECKACFWVLDEKEQKLKEPFFIDIPIKQVICSKPTFNDEDLFLFKDRFVNDLKAPWWHRYEEIKYEKNQLRKSKIRRNYKSFAQKISKLNKRMQHIKNFIDELISKSEFHTVKTIYNGKEAYVLQLHLPNILTDYFKPFSYKAFSGEYVTFKRNIEFNLNYPFTLFSSDNEISTNETNKKNLTESLEEVIEKEYPLKLRQLNTEILEKQKGLGFDFETKNWNKIYILNNLMHLDKNKLLEIAEKLNCNLSELKWKNKGWIIREIQHRINQNKNESITIASLCNIKEDYNYLITSFNVKEKEIYVKDPISNKEVKFNIVTVKNQDKLISKLNELVNTFQPLFVFGHNHLAFDLNIGKVLPNESIKIGVKYAEPEKIFSVADFRQLVINPGRVGIDMMLYSQQCMKNKDNTLDSVFESLFGLNNRSKKTLSHADLIMETRKAERGDKEAALRILRYAAMDGIKSYWNGEKVKKEHIILSKVFSTLPERVDATSWKTLSNEYHSKRIYAINHHFPQELDNLVIWLSSSAEKLLNAKQLKFSDFDLSNFEHAVIQNYLEIKQNTRIKTKKGLFDGTIAKLIPSINSFYNLLMKDRNLSELVSEFEESSGQKKLRLSYALENILRLPAYLLLSENSKAFNEFFPECNLTEKEFHKFKLQYYENLKKSAELFKNTRLINYKKDILLLNNNDSTKELIEQFSSQSILVNLGEAYSLSGTKGTFIGKTNDWEFLLGFSSPRARKGEKFPIEASFYESFIRELICNRNKENAFLTFLEHLDYIVSSEFLSKISEICRNRNRSRDEPLIIDEEIKRGNLKESEIDSSLIIEIEAKRNFYDYSSYFNSPRKTAQGLINGKKGDIIRYTYPKEIFLEKMLGRKKNKKSSISYNYSEGKMSRLIYWGFLEKKSDKLRLFNQLVNGSLNNDYIIKLIIE